MLLTIRPNKTFSTPVTHFPPSVTRANRNTVYHPLHHGDANGTDQDGSFHHLFIASTSQFTTINRFHLVPILGHLQRCGHHLRPQPNRKNPP